MMRPRSARAESIEEMSRLCSVKTAEQLRAILREAVSRGTGKGVDLLGSTSVARLAPRRRRAEKTMLGLLCSTAQFYQVVTVLIERGGSGAKAALYP